MKLSCQVFSMAWIRHEPKAIALAFGGVISGSYKDDIDLDGYIEFTGLVLTAAYYGSIGGAIASSKKKGNGHPPGKTKVEVTESEEHNFEYRILDYHRWPQNDQFVKEK